MGTLNSINFYFVCEHCFGTLAKNLALLCEEKRARRHLPSVCSSFVLERVRVSWAAAHGGTREHWLPCSALVTFPWAAQPQTPLWHTFSRWDKEGQGDRLGKSWANRGEVEELQ